MNAKEFIKQYGWEISTRLQREMLGITEQVADSVAVWGQSEWDRLKKLVDAWELVESCGGLLCAKIQISTASFLWGEPSFKYAELKKAIELVEGVK